MKKYEIIKNGIDDYTLQYKDKKIDFHSNVEIMTELQSINILGNQRMVLKLAKENMTPNDLIKKQIIDGKTYYDNSGKDAFLKSCIDEETTKIFNDAIKKMLGKPLMELISEIELTETNEVEEFSKELGECLVGRFQGSKNGENK